MTDAKTIETRLKEEAKKLLESGAVSVVLGLWPGYDEKHPMPFAASTPEEVDEPGLQRISARRTWPVISGAIPQAQSSRVAVKGADSRAVIVLIQEGKVKREDLVLLGIPFNGLKDQATGKEIDEKTTGAHTTRSFTTSCWERKSREAASVRPTPSWRNSQSMGRDERWAFWEKELAQVHPLLCMPQGLPDVLLRSVLRGPDEAAVGGQVARTSRRQPHVPPDEVLSPGRPLRGLRGMQQGLPREHPPVPFPQGSGQGMRGDVQAEVRHGCQR